MRVLKAILLALVLGLPTAMPAHALGGGGGGGGDGSSSSSGNRLTLRFNLFGGGSDDDGYGEGEEEDEDPRVIIMPAVVAPLSQDSRLSGFAYVHLRVRLHEGADIWGARENLHYALDQLVRTAHRHNLSNEDGTGLNEDRAEEIWAETLSALYGGNYLDYVEISSVDTRLVRR